VRRGVIDRRTRETSIALKLSLDGKGRYDVTTGIRFLDHMLELVARHGAFDLTIRAEGDLDVDQHHTVEDLGIALGEAVSAALGTRRGINRAGYFVMPMDETLAVAAIDLGGRVHAVTDLRVKARIVGDLQSELVADFFDGFAQGAIIGSRRPSRRSHARSASPARAIAGWPACCQAPRDCCDRPGRLRRRQPHVGTQGIRGRRG
jgi:imidazoleglycerol-phosphate dehydratase